MSRCGKALGCLVCTAGVAAAFAVLAGATTTSPNGLIAFKKALGHPSLIASVKPDASGLRLFPRTKQVSDDDPDWSPNGSLVAFERCPLGPGHCTIVEMRADGSGAKRLGPANDDRAFPAWSPDGREIAYTRSWGGVKNGEIRYSGIYVMNASGGGARQVVNVSADAPYSGDAQHPVWAPDGKRLAFEVANSSTGAPPGAHAVFLVNADGSDLKQITPSGMNAGGRLDWSPDGRLILFRAPAKNDRGNLYTIAPDGSGLKQLTRFPSLVVSAGSFSPDGKWVTFAKSSNLWVMRVDGTGGRQLTHGISVWSPDWGTAK
jgi:TolB protein